LPTIIPDRERAIGACYDPRELMRSLLVLAVATIFAGCASARHYVQIAEGLSSPTVTEGIRVAPRMFSPSQFVEACRTAVPVARLEVEPDLLDLVLGNLYSLDSLTVVAVDGADIAVPGVPIVLEAEDTSPPVLQLRSDDPDLDQGRLRAIAPGEFRMRIRTTCGMPQAETIIRGRVGG
jgi:hypothetical protein